MALRAAPTFLRTIRKLGLRAMSNVGEYGSGVGKGGGSGGTIRDAGGSFGRMEAAHEEEFFRKLRVQQLEELRMHKKEVMAHTAENIQVLEDSVHHLEDHVRRNQEAIARHKKRIEDLQQKHHLIPSS